MNIRFAICSVTRIRRIALLSTSGIALAMVTGGQGIAQTPGSADTEAVVVTATRIQNADFEAPTPTTVIGSADIQRAAEPNVFTTITQLPVLEGSTGTTVGNGGASAGTNGLSQLGLRGLGSIRTLVLIDGQRVVGAYVSGTPDISEFPQMLLRRVDVVTGGASASYGSDAIAGVVNFITEKKFEGFKLDVNGGISTYGDNATAQVRGVAGTSFLSGRAHVEGSFELSNEAGVGVGPLGDGPGPAGRSWFHSPAFLQTSIAATPPGQPQYVPVENGQDYQFSPLGLITAGPLQGTGFTNGGQVYAYNYGSNGVPTFGANGAVTGCVSPYCVGGDTSGNYTNNLAPVASVNRTNNYLRLSYDIGAESEIYATGTVSEVWTKADIPSAFRQNASMTIQCGNSPGGPNAYLPASINAACVADHITSFQYGTDLAYLTPLAANQTLRNLKRVVVGTDGAVDIFGNRWAYDAYFEHGINDVAVTPHQFPLTPHLTAAADAVAITAANQATYPGQALGSIVCRSVVAQSAGCLPLDVIGNANVPTAVQNWVAPFQEEYQHTGLREESASFSVNGEPATLWAGPLDVALGMEYREEAYTAIGDAYGAGLSATSPYTAQEQPDPTLSTAGTNWQSGNYHDGAGNYHVFEAFVEAGVPLFNTPTWGKADLDIAGRATGYSTAGYVQTWKVGTTWATPLDGLRLRALQSRDVRAPNLSELFAAPVSAHQTVTNDATNTVVQFQAITIGNAALHPEKSQTTEVGVVFQPSWLEGFNASLDYWRVAVKGQITSLSAQQEEDTCFYSGGTSPVCADLNLGAANPTITSQSFNLSSTVTDGFDFEVSQTFDLQSWDAPGDFSVRALATHTSKYITNPGVYGLPITETAGNNTGSTPLWRINATENWNNGPWNVLFTERWFSDGVYNANYITCTSGCPVPTVQHPTISDNHMRGAFYVDFGATYSIDSDLQIYTKIDNLFNQDPAPDPNVNNGLNPTLYDVVGRMFHLGVRYNVF